MIPPDGSPRMATSACSQSGSSRYITGATFNGNRIAAVDCGKFPVGTIISVRFLGTRSRQWLSPAGSGISALRRTLHLGVPAGPAHGAAVVTPDPTAFPAVPNIGEDGTWTLDTQHMDPCGDAYHFVVCDRTNYDSRGNALCASETLDSAWRRHPNSRTLFDSNRRLVSNSAWARTDIAREPKQRIQARCLMTS